MSSIGIMQPYLFPYIGYFQLIRATDHFVFYNDVNFIKKGWIQRNRILLNGKDFLFTIPCVNASQNKLICETEIQFDERERNKLLATLLQAYKKAPFFKEVFTVLEKIISKDCVYIDELAISSIKGVCDYLEMKPEFVESANRYGNEHLKREERLIDICGKENLRHYINPIGGAEIYTKVYFLERGVELQFLRPKPISYKQYNHDFVPWLSIIDVLMFNDHHQVKDYLNEFELI